MAIFQVLDFELEPVPAARLRRHTSQFKVDRVFYRLAALFLLVSALSLSGYYRKRAAREGTIERSAEGGRALLARTLVALPLLAMILAYVVSPGVLAWAAVSLSTGIRIGAVLMGVVALLASAWTLSSIGSNISPTVLTREGQRLVEQGPYRWIRHPLYSSGALLLISIGVMAQNLLILCWTALGLILLLAVVIPREERELVGRFGVRYEEYRDRTGAMLPKLRWP